MKRRQTKAVALIMALILILLVGCSTSAQTTTPATTTPATTPAATEKKPDYPKEPITWLIATSAGGGYDLGTRLIARYLPKYLPNKVDIVLENRSGGGQMIAVHALYAAKPDGYTICTFNNIGALMAQFIRGEEIKFDMAKFEYLGSWQTDIRAIGVRKDLKATTWDELVALSKKTPLLAGSGGAGTGQHTDMQVIEAVTGLNLKYVHYDGSAQVDPAIGRNEIDMETAQTATVMSLEEQKLGRAFCVLDVKRDPMAPNVPTALEVGMPKEQLETILGLPFFGVERTIAAPPGTPKEVVAILRDALWKVFQDPEYLKEAAAMNQTNNPIKGEDLGKKILDKMALVPKYPELLEVLKAGK